MAKFNQIHIQDYWFGEKDADAVLKSYELSNEIKPVTCERVKEILSKSKKKFLSGSPIVFVEDIDEQITDLLSYSKN